MKVQLHSNSQPAAQATNRTLKALPPMMGGYLREGADGEILFDENGLAEAVPTGNEKFFAQAIIEQGYVRRIFA